MQLKTVEKRARAECGDYSVVAEELNGIGCDAVSTESYGLFEGS